MYIFVCNGLQILFVPFQDIGDLVVLMARRRFVPQDIEANSDSGTGTGGSGNVSGGSGGPTPPTSGKINRTPKMICHVFER